LASTGIFQFKGYYQRLCRSQATGNSKCRHRDKRPLTLYESASLNSAEDSQNRSKNTYNSGPSDHRRIEAIILFSIMSLAALIGVWSIVFWDSLGAWRWLVSALGWAVMIGCLIQGFPIRP